MGHQHVKQAGQFGVGNLRHRRYARPGQHLQAIVMTSHVAFKQGIVQAMQVPNRIRYAEQRLEIHVQRRVTQGSNVNQGYRTVRRLQR